ncbi:MAG: radical SAM protein [bacterium]
MLSNGITVELIDAVNDHISVDSILAIIRGKRPSYVALNIFTTNMRLVREIVESVEGTRFIIGGLPTKSIYKTILSWNTISPVDIVLGEGDFVVSAIVQGKSLDVIYHDDKNRVITVTAMSPYFPTDISNLSLDRSFFTNQIAHPVSGLNETCIVTSRGCIHNCAFCAAARSLNMETPIRERNALSVENEIQMLREQDSTINAMRVLDDLFLRNAESVERAVKIFGQTPIVWRAMAHVLSFRKLEDAHLSALKHSGCFEVFIGIESGSPRILKKIRKTTDVDFIKWTIGRLFRFGINVKGYFIFDFESETVADMEMTYELASWLKETSLRTSTRFRTSAFQFRPYHGTELYHDIVQKGRIVSDMIPQELLSQNIGRRKFNFASGNFSEVSDDVLQRFITSTLNLNR